MKEHKEYAQTPEASDETLVESPREEEEEPGLAVGDLGHLAFEPFDEQLYSAAV